MHVDRKIVETTARLARLKLSEAELDAMTRDLGKITAYIDRLAEADVSSVHETSHAIGTDALREDAARDSFRTETALSNAPAQEAGFIKVPKVVE